MPTINETQTLPHPKLIPEKVAREYVPGSRQTYWRMRKDGLPHYRLNSKLLYDLDELLAFARRKAA